MSDDRKRDIGDGPVEHRHRQRQPDADHRPVAAWDRQAVFGLRPGFFDGLEVHDWRLIGLKPNEPQPEGLPMLLATENLIDELAQIRELGELQPFPALDALGHPARFETQLRRFLEPQPGVRDRTDLAR